jgi:hypothetical protein
MEHLPQLFLKEHIVLELINKASGEVLQREELHNTIVNSGKERVAKLINGTSATYFRAIAIGTGITGALATDSSLETETTRALATLTYEASYKSKFEHTFTFGSGESYNITEAGIFDSDVVSGSTMLDRFTFSAKAVDADIDLKVTITITVA